MIARPNRPRYQACSLTAWLHDELHSAGLPAVCIETRQANAAMKTMPNKTDRNDGPLDAALRIQFTQASAVAVPELQPPSAHRREAKARRAANRASQPHQKRAARCCVSAYA